MANFAWNKAFERNSMKGLFDPFYDPVLEHKHNLPPIHPASPLILATWMAGIAFSLIPIAAGFGTASEYLNHTSKVPITVPILCFFIAVGTIMATAKAAKLVKKHVRYRHEKESGFHR